MVQFTFHLLPNAHLDPVWLWDWREGLNEGIITCRAVLDMMDEDPELTFVRGEAAIYRHIERTDPATFERIKEMVRQGRWDVVGGTEIQPDTNLPSTETFCRHYLYGKQYFWERFGKKVTVAWAADSFGHSGGMPEILTACGMTGFCFTRPSYDIVPIEKSAFWWEGSGGNRVLAYRPRVGWYGAERGEMPNRLDLLLEAASKSNLQNVGVLFGLGNHGGGPSRQQVQDIRDWGAKHPEVELKFSGLHQLFAAIEDEVKQGLELPLHKGELNFVLRGCYSSVAKFKFLYRRAENLILRAEMTDTIISAAKLLSPSPGTPGDGGGEGQSQISNLKFGISNSPHPNPPPDYQGRGTYSTDRGVIRAAWDSILFNSFHDILPGSSIERAFDEQIQWIGGAIHQARVAEFNALNHLASQIDTRTTKSTDPNKPGRAALLVWNPHAHEFDGYVELEVNLDYRPIWEYQNRVDQLPLKISGSHGTVMPHQVIETENRFMPNGAWRRRIVMPITLPALGWNVIQMGWVEEFKPPKVAPVVTAGKNFISNGIYEIHAETGASGVEVKMAGRDLFGRKGLQVTTVADPWGSWGGMAEEKDAVRLAGTQQLWQITQTRILETGPLRAALWARFEAGHSRLDLTFMLYGNRSTIDIRARLFINERSARVKLMFPGCDLAEFDVPGGQVTRGPVGQVPGGRWVRAIRGQQVHFGLATDALYDFDVAGGSLGATICRASRYADDGKIEPDEIPWRPTVDAGELKFNMVISPGGAELPRLAEELERPLVSLLVPAHDGPLRRSGSLGILRRSSMQLLALKQAEDGQGLIIRLLNRGGKSGIPMLTLLKESVRLSVLKPGEIGTWRICQTGLRWSAHRVTADESV